MKMTMAMMMEALFPCHRRRHHLSSWSMLFLTSLSAFLVGSTLAQQQQQLHEGDVVPDVKFFTRTRVASGDGENNADAFEWKIRTTADYFANNKRVVLFAIPGAFTPTCSETHLPGYEESYLDIRAMGIDDVYCLSVNDAFVMRQWGLQQGLTEDKTPNSLGGFTQVKLIPDGAAAFTKAMGMMVPWDTERGFGERSWRYSMVVNNGVIEKMFVEQPMIANSVADPFEVSDAQTMLEYLENTAATTTKHSSSSGGQLAHKLQRAWKQPKKEGDVVPNVQFLTRTRVLNTADPFSPSFDWKTVTTADYMAGKRVVLFALPGAFTPTCSVSHLPGYEAAYDEMTQSLGIDEVYCLSVNDAFVMRQWGLDQGLTENTATPGNGRLGTFTKVKLIPDGTAAFTRYMGMSTVWTSQTRGFGERSWRYSMVVDDGVIEKIFMEPNRHQDSEPDPFVVSDADTMLAYLQNATNRRTTGGGGADWKAPHLPFPEHDIPSPWTTPLQKHDKVPQMEFMTRTRVTNPLDSDNPFDWKVRTTDDYFANKRVVVFALPGAFTPTCSFSHLPEYEDAYDEIRGYGIDEVYCLSVNDAFVMRQWGLSLNLTEDKTPGSLGFTRVKLIPDGTAHFTRAMGMSTVWASERGFGERSWRYSMVVNHGVIEEIFEEQPRVQNSGPDPYQVSDAQTLIKWLKDNQTADRHLSPKETIRGQDEGGQVISNISISKKTDALIGARDMIDTIIDQTNAGPLFVRLAWQDSGTFDVNIKKEWPAAGGAIGSIRFEPEISHKANAGLKEAVALLKPVKKAFPDVSYADIFQMASARSVEFAGGPSIAMKYGRVDVDSPDGCSPEGNLPEAEPRDNGEFGCDMGTTSTKDKTAAGHLRKVFYRMGLNDEEIVALSGAHTFGRAYKDRSGLGAASTKFTNGSKQLRSDGKEAAYTTGGSSWTENWLVFDNSYFRTIPYKHADPELLSLTSDKTIFQDEGFRPFALKFRQSQEEFFTSYARAHKKLSELGSKFDPQEGIVLPRKERVKMVLKQAGKVVGHQYVYVNVDENGQVIENPKKDEL